MSIDNTLSDKYIGLFVYLKELPKKISLYLTKSPSKEINRTYNLSSHRLVPRKNSPVKNLITLLIIIILASQVVVSKKIGLKYLNHDNYIILLSKEQENKQYYKVKIQILYQVQ